MLYTLALIGAALAGLWCILVMINLTVFRAPKMQHSDAFPNISVLIPARNEASNIADVLATVLAQRNITLEVVVCDDGSTDDTSIIAREIAERDTRVRLITGKALPQGWNGKQHACAQLAAAARYELLFFLDADVRLVPDALAAMTSTLRKQNLACVSGFPRHLTNSWAERLIVPQIMVVLLGYLPVPFAKLFGHPMFATGCGQLMLVAADSYQRAGGHSAFKSQMHDGLHLPRNLRKAGDKTDIIDAAPIATCRMYQTWPELLEGFSKNATEGMATPIGLPIWTLLLGGGHLLPLLLLPIAGLLGQTSALYLSGGACGALLVVRALLALRVRQDLRCVPLHFAGVGVNLWIQWRALVGALRGRKAQWRGRSYSMQ
ncbi:MAG: glycosyltransferase family 2 protein [Pseudomonadota bacterium]